MGALQDVRLYQPECHMECMATEELNRDRRVDDVTVAS